MSKSNAGEADFEPLKPTNPYRKDAKVSLVRLVRENLKASNKPIDYLDLFFDEEVFQLLVESTNRNAMEKAANNSRKRKWENVSLGEMYNFLGIIILMGIWRAPAYKDYWETDEYHPSYPFASKMSLFRFEQIKRYFHVEKRANEQDQEQEQQNSSDGSRDGTRKWYYKVEWLFANLKQKFKHVVIPGTNMAVDEMMVRFYGRSELLHEWC